MELQIKDLVDSIKKDGIDAAKKESDKIISQAQEKADAIVEKAKAEAEKILENNKKEIEILKESALVSAQQARRDAVLSFKTEIEKQYKRILTQDVKKALDESALASMIKAAISDQDVSELTAEVSEVSETLKSQLAEEIKKGLEIKPVKNIEAGFRLSSKDGSGFFDCTDDEIAKMLMPFFGELSI